MLFEFHKLEMMILLDLIKYNEEFSKIDNISIMKLLEEIVSKEENKRIHLENSIVTKYNDLMQIRNSIISYGTNQNYLRGEAQYIESVNPEYKKKVIQRINDALKYNRINLEDVIL